MDGHLFISAGDLTQLSADAIAFSANNMLSRVGNLHSSFEAHVPGFAAFLAAQRPPPGETVEVGSTFWLPLRADRKPHGLVVVVSTGGSGGTAADKAALTVRASLGRAVHELRAAGHTGRLLIALPTFRVGMGGDRRQRLQSARIQVAAAAKLLTKLPDVDVAFIAYTPTLHQIYLEARRQELGLPRSEETPVPALEEALGHGEGVLFAGAGLSFGAGLPDWAQFVDRLKHELDLPADLRADYLDLAQWYHERRGGDALAEIVRQTYAAPDTPSLPTLAHYLLLNLPFQHVITTNYDDLLERTLTALKRYPVRVVQQSDVARTGRGDAVYVVKWHGDAQHAEEIILRRDDYDNFFERRPAMALLLEGLLLTRVFFFVGYSLRDPNFRQVWARLARMLREARRPAFATTFEGGGQAGVYLAEQWRRKGLHLVQIPGTSKEERERSFLLFLDRLSDRVTLGRPGLFLAPDADFSPRLKKLRDALVEDVGGEVAALCARDLGKDEVGRLAEVLRFLTELGWRPPLGGGADLCRLWEHLAGHARTVAERRAMLTRALAAAEAFADVRRIREALDALS